jgi:hypothetical protein
VGEGSLERAYKLRASRLAPGQSHAGSVDTDQGGCQHADESGKPEALQRAGQDAVNAQSGDLLWNG